MSEKNFNVKNISKVVWKNVFIILITTIIFGLGAIYMQSINSIQPMNPLEIL